MAGQFLTGSTTFMSRHTAGRNSTGMYIISGIPQMKTFTADGSMDLESLSREITITVPQGTWDINFNNAAPNPAADKIRLTTGMTITLPIRTTHVRVTRVSNAGGDTCSVVAVLTGLDKTGYPATKGDGKLTTS